jgi:hypothetical protein
MATVDDAIELLRDPLNLTYLGDPSAGLGVKTSRVVALLHERGAESEQEALVLIRAATKALGGEEVIVQRPGALRADLMGSAPRRAEAAFWVPGRRQRPPTIEPPPPTPSSRLRRLLRRT